MIALFIFLFTIAGFALGYLIGRVIRELFDR